MKKAPTVRTSLVLRAAPRSELAVLRGQAAWGLTRKPQTRLPAAWGKSGSLTCASELDLCLRPAVR